MLKCSQLSASSLKKDDNEDDCPICLDTIGKSNTHDAQPKTRKLTCNHLFHAHCIENWLSNASKKHECPVCRNVEYGFFYWRKTLQEFLILNTDTFRTKIMLRFLDYGHKQNFDMNRLRLTSPYYLACRKMYNFRVILKFAQIGIPAIDDRDKYILHAFDIRVNKCKGTYPPQIYEHHIASIVKDLIKTNNSDLTRLSNLLILFDPNYRSELPSAIYIASKNKRDDIKKKLLKHAPIQYWLLYSDTRTTI